MTFDAEKMAREHGLMVKPPPDVAYLLGRHAVEDAAAVKALRAAYAAGLRRAVEIAGTGMAARSLIVREIIARIEQELGNEKAE